MNPKRHHVLITWIILISLFCETSGSGQESNKPKEQTSYWEKLVQNRWGIDPQILDQIHKDIKWGKYGTTDHFLVIKDGKLVVDHHYKQDYWSIPLKFK
ncbi:MAG: hypothetical protein HRT71_21155 [Flavobacteriales bacterium]|nr:hypothetical protein [Flavobacteriales bacterium]